MNPTPHAVPAKPVGHTKELQAVLRTLYQGNCCRILGPRHHHKSRLMRRVKELLTEAQTHYAIYIRLAEIEREDEARFFADLFDQIALQLKQFFTLPSVDPVASALTFQQALLAVSRISARNLALLLDNLEIVPPNLAAALLGALRAVFSIVSDHAGARVQAVVCGNLHLNQVALDNVSRFDSISTLVLITELDEEARVEWAEACWQKGLCRPNAAAMTTLLDATGGDPLLIELVIELCAAQPGDVGERVITAADVVAALAAFVEQPVVWQVREVLHQIESNPSLLSSVLLILDAGAVPTATLPINAEESPTVLDLCGAFRLVGRAYQIRNPLWERLLRQHLVPAHVGKLYAIAGDWTRAIQHLGLAIREGQWMVKPELFSAVINAIYGSATLEQAFWQLATGAATAYPDADLHCYFRDHGRLVRIYPSIKPGESSDFALHERQWPAVEALNGPEYSILPTLHGIRLFFPIRIAPATAALGLLSLTHLTTADSPYAQREERLQLLNFLRQAARALESKEQFATMLNASQRRAEKLNTLNQLLTALLHAREQAEQRLLPIVLAAITHGWGLEFNRALLFVPDPAHEALVLQRAIGHLTHEEADAEWSQAPYDRQTVDEWLSELFQREPLPNQHHQPLQEALATLRIPLTNREDPLVHCFTTRQPLHSAAARQSIYFDMALYAHLRPPRDFVLVPLRAGSASRGVIYVDNKFTARPVTAESFELLQSFVNQAALIIENARTFALEKAQTAALKRLLELEERVSNQITLSIPALLQAIVDAARELVEADCTLIYPLHSTDLNHDRRTYDVEHITGANVRNPLRNPPRLSGGHAAWVIQAGMVVIPVVAVATLPNTKIPLATSSFIQEEGIEAFVGVRLGTQDAPVAVLYFDWRRPRQFLEEELKLMQLFANFAAVAIPSARRYQRVRSELQRRTEELDELRTDLRAGLTLDEHEGQEPGIAWILRRVRDRTQISHAYLVRREPYDQSRLYALDAHGQLYSEVTPLQYHAENATDLAIMQRTSAAQQSGTPSFRYPDAQYGLQVPIVAVGNTLATLYLEDRTDEAFLPAQQDYLRHLANRLALTLEQSERTQALHALVEIALTLTKGQDAATMLEAIGEKAMQAMRTVSAITLYCLDETTGQLILEYATGIRDEENVARRPPYTHPRLEQILQLDEPLFVDDVMTNDLLHGTFVEREAIRSVAAFPLQINQTNFGCIFFNYRTPHSFDEGARNLLAIFAQLAAIAIHQARMDQRLEAAHERELLLRISDLSAGLIHDVNSTLANIPDLVAEVESNWRAKRDITPPLGELRQLAAKTEELSTRLFELAFRQELRPEAVSVNDLIQQALLELTNQKPTHVNLAYVADELLPIISLDRLLITQLLHNLIMNAWEAIPVGRTGTIQITVEQAPERLRIHVRDNGRGIMPEHLPHIFKPNFTTKTAQPGRHGLGLSYCRLIAHEHQGDLAVQSTPNLGTTFTVTLPLRIFFTTNKER